MTTNLRDLKLSLRNRISISSQSLFYLKDLIEDRKGSLEKLTLMLDGTMVDAIICQKWLKDLQKSMPYVMITF